MRYTCSPPRRSFPQFESRCFGNWSGALSSTRTTSIPVGSVPFGCSSRAFHFDARRSPRRMGGRRGHSMTDLWYYGDGETPRGPVSLAELVAALGKIPEPRKTLVWRQGFPDWKPAELVPELSEELPSAPTPAPAPEPAPPQEPQAPAPEPAAAPAAASPPPP